MKPVQLWINDVARPDGAVPLRIVRAIVGDRSGDVRDIQEWAGIVVCDKPEAELRAATLTLAAETLEKALA